MLCHPQRPLQVLGLRTIDLKQFSDLDMITENISMPRLGTDYGSHTLVKPAGLLSLIGNNNSI